MRRFLGGFLILLMLTPSLACAMPVCFDGIQSEKPAAHPCADHQQAHEQSAEQSNQGTNSIGSVDLLLDCMGVDLQTADTVVLEKPRHEVKYVVYKTKVENLFPDQEVDIQPLSIRGPPPDTDLLENRNSSLILATQRFRI